MMCKTVISRLIATFAAFAIVTAASAQSSSGNIGDALTPSKTVPASIESGFVIDRGHQFLRTTDLTKTTGALSAEWSTSASDWDARIASANTYTLAPAIGDEAWYDDEERLITTIAIVVLILILVK